MGDRRCVEIGTAPVPLRAACPRIVRDLRGLPPVLAQSGPLELRLATTRKEIRRSQRLRFQVFYHEGGAVAAGRDARDGRDRCPFDRICDHLLVVDRDRGGRHGVVGSYRLLRSEVATGNGGFYSASEFDLSGLLDRHPTKRLLELGRSCVHADYRSKRVIELLWRGIGVYAQHHSIDGLIGCASLPGTDPEALAAPLSFLFHHAAAAPEWQVRPLAGRAIRMDRIARDALDARRAMVALPPLVKAYMRTGGRFASEAVADHQFGTNDLFTVLPFAQADRRHMAYFGGEELIPGSTALTH